MIYSAIYFSLKQYRGRLKIFADRFFFYLIQQLVGGIWHDAWWEFEMFIVSMEHFDLLCIIALY